MTYRVALIGAESLSQRHTRAWATLPDAEIVGVLVPPFGEDDLPASAFADWPTLLSEARPDIIDICTPPPMNPLWVKQAAEAGKALLLAGPLAGTAPDAAACLAAVKQAGVAAMPTGLRRLSPEFGAAHRLVQSGGVGTPAAVRLAQVFCENGEGTEYVGGVLEELTPDFDWLRWTFGPVGRVFARGFLNQSFNRNVWDYVLITLRFQSGAMAHVTGMLTFGGSPRTTLEVAGDAGLIEQDSARTGPPPNALASELAAFLKSLDTGAAPPVTLEECVEATRLGLAVRESLDTGKVVTL